MKKVKASMLLPLERTATSVRFLISLGTLLVASSVACSQAVDSGPGSAKPGGDCPGARGSAMTRISLPEGRTFCIDNRETTQSEYAAFLADAFSWHPAGEAAYCQTLGRAPRMQVMDDVPANCHAGVYDPVKKGNLPMVCASWCDAYAYCAWAGKRLCQRTDGTPLQPTPWEDDKVFAARAWQNNEWAFACTSGGNYAASTGQAGEQALKACGGVDLPADATTCHSPDPAFANISRMVGGAAEWVGAIEMDVHNGAEIWRAYQVPGDWGMCELLAMTGPDGSDNSGIRCCGD